MTESDAERWEDLLSAEVLRKIQEIPVEERLKRLLPAFMYARELAEEHPCSADAVTPEHAREVVDENATPKLFRDMFDPRLPLSSDWALNQATGIGKELLRYKQRVLWQYCGDLPDPNEALSYAYLGLLDLGKRMSNLSREEVLKPYWFLKMIIRRSIDRDIDLNIIKHHDPWLRAHARLFVKFRKELELADPSNDKDKIDEEAARLAEEALGSLRQWLYRTSYEEAETAASVEDLSELVHSKLMLDLMEEQLQKPPYTDIDRDTWARWRAVGFRGRDIDWEATSVKASTGAQRLHALLRKLRE